jgi:protein-S-isoprenylcysteine O-methyltransferase Ste14
MSPVMRTVIFTVRAKFGAEYEEYCRSVPRWFPRLKIK